MTYIIIWGHFLKVHSWIIDETTSFRQIALPGRSYSPKFGTQQLPDAELSNGALVSAPDVTAIPGEAESWPEQVLGVSSSKDVTEWGDLEKPCKWLNKFIKMLKNAQSQNLGPH